MTFNYQPNLIIAVGTQVVSHIDVKGSNGDILFTAGAVGVIVKSPVDNTHSYRVRFPDSTEISMKRQEFTIRKHHAQPQDNRLAEYSLGDTVIYRCIVGSRAYGLSHEDSDVDLRGVYLPPAELHWSLFGIPEQLESDETQECYWELQKFLTLALKANPNVLECLYTPLVEYTSPLAEEMLSIRQIFLSRLIYQTYNGYVMSQFKKLDHHIKNHGEIKWKHAMHLIRLLISGITALREGYVPVHVEDHREHLLAIRRNEIPWEEVNGWRLQLHRDFDTAFKNTVLPDRPNYERANEFLVKARRSAVS